MRKEKRTVSGPVEVQTLARSLRVRTTPLTIDLMYRAVRAMEDDGDDSVRKRLQGSTFANVDGIVALTRELGEDVCAVLDQLLKRELQDEALEYIRLEENRLRRERDILNRLSAEFNWARLRGAG